MLYKFFGTFRNVVFIIALLIFIMWLLDGYLGPSDYACPFQYEGEQREACYFEQLALAAKEKNLKEKIYFFSELGSFYSHSGKEEEGRHLLQAALSLCNSRPNQTKNNDLVCSSIKTELNKLNQARK